MIDSRSKGRNAERAVEVILQDAGLTTERALGGRTQVHGDILCEGMAIEVKNREKLSLITWSAQHELAVPPHITPVVVYRSNRQPWRASMLLQDLVEMVVQGKS